MSARTDRADWTKWDWWCPACKLGVVDQEVEKVRDDGVLECPRCKAGLTHGPGMEPAK